MDIFITKITPLFAVCVVAFIYLIVAYFLSGIDYAVVGFVIGYLILLVAVIALDRFLVTKFAYKKFFIFELVFLILGTVSYLYAISSIMINIETKKSYFFVLYDDSGLKKSEIPTTKLFNKNITIKSDDPIHINKSLEYEAQINPPQPWRYSYSSQKMEASVAGEKVIVAIYAKDLLDKELETTLKAEVERLETMERK